MRRLVLLSVFIACGSPPPRRALTLRVAMWGPLGQLTARTGDNDSLATIAQPWVYESLARLDLSGDIAPVLASRIVPLAGGRFAVELRRDAKFSDGAPVTPREVIDSFGSRARVTAAGGLLEIESTVPSVPTQALLASVLVHRQSKGAELGTGPFAVQSSAPSELTLVRRQPASGRVNELHVIAFATPREAFAHTLKGDANLIPDVEPRWLEFFRDVPTLRIVRGTGVATDSIVFSMRLSRQERVALAARLDSNDVRALAYGDECVESRKAHASSSEIPRGPRLDVLSWGPFERLGAAARRTLGTRAGELTHLSISDLIRRLRTRDFELVTLRPLVAPPMMMTAIWRTGAPDNPSGYSNAAVDRALEAGDWAAARAAMHDDPPAAFICTRDRLAVVDSRIKNPSLGPIELLESLPDWEVAQ